MDRSEQGVPSIFLREDLYFFNNKDDSRSEEENLLILI